jgi:TonB family protein
VQQKVVEIIPLIAPDIAPYQPKLPPRQDKLTGGGGGGDRSPLPASKGRMPKAALKQFTPPMAVVNNPNPKLTIDPSLIIPPDVPLPQVNLPNYGDPLAKIGPLSNGPGSSGGIGSGSGGGVGSGRGGGFGPGEGGGVGGGFYGGVYRVGGGVTAPALLYKVEPEYSEEARKAKYQGTVVVYAEVDPNGRAMNLRIMQSLGLGLDEKALEAIKKWRFRPGYKDGKPVTVAATIEVNFRLL